MVAANSLHPQARSHYIKLQKLMEVETEKGSSGWLVALPVESHGFSLYKGFFGIHSVNEYYTYIYMYMSC